MTRRALKIRSNVADLPQQRAFDRQNALNPLEAVSKDPAIRFTDADWLLERAFGRPAAGRMP